MEYLQEIHKRQLFTCTKGHYKPNDAQHTDTSTVSESYTGINVTQQEQKQKGIRITLSRVLLHLPFFPSVTDTFPDYFLNFWITDFTIAGRFHPLQVKPELSPLTN